ncbi:MAG: TraB/GumN family protein [Gammaproteobacteria bacterium]|nr:TraB/GumN family protein [Gammaproteobacteria bacterium]
MILTAAGLAAAADPALEQACRPFTSAAESGPERSRDEIPFGQAVFWRLEKADTVNHPPGTLHSQDRRVTSLSPRQRLILARSSRLLIEIVPDAGSSQAYADAIHSEGGPGLREDLPAPQYQRLQQIAGAYGLPPENPYGLNEPWAVFSQIGRPRPIRGPTQEHCDPR